MGPCDCKVYRCARFCGRQGLHSRIGRPLQHPPKCNQCKFHRSPPRANKRVYHCILTPIAIVKRLAHAFPWCPSASALSPVSETTQLQRCTHTVRTMCCCVPVVGGQAPGPRLSLVPLCKCAPGPVPETTQRQRCTHHGRCTSIRPKSGWSR